MYIQSAQQPVFAGYGAMNMQLKDEATGLTAPQKTACAAAKKALQPWMTTPACGLCPAPETCPTCMTLADCPTTGECPPPATEENCLVYKTDPAPAGGIKWWWIPIAAFGGAVIGYGATKMLAKGR